MPLSKGHFVFKTHGSTILLSDIINYFVKGLIILIGLLFIIFGGDLMPQDADPIMFRVFGVIFILFGIYRVLLYRANKKKYKFKDEDN